MLPLCRCVYARDAAGTEEDLVRSGARPQWGDPLSFGGARGVCVQWSASTRAAIPGLTSLRAPGSLEAMNSGDDTVRASNGEGASFRTPEEAGARDAERLSRLMAAASAGDLEAQAELGACLVGGRGVEASPRRGVQWLRLAAGRGHARARYNLAICYAEGKGVPASETRALGWLRKAAAQGVPEAQYEMAYRLLEGRGCARDVFGAQRLLLEAARSGMPEAQFLLADTLLHGFGTGDDAVDTEQGLRWLRAAASAGYAPAELELGVCFSKGRGVQQDPAEAVAWFRRAALKGMAQAQYNLALCYDRGEGVAPDPEEAADWYRKAADAGLAQAAYNLALSYDSGEGYALSPQDAYLYLKRSADLGHPAGAFQLACLLLTGQEALPADVPEALRYLRVAAKAGHADARALLERLTQAGVGAATVDGARER